MTSSPAKELKIFYCYAHEDQTLREQLEQHLSNLKRLYHLKTWFDRQILPGENWEEVLEENLNTADLVFLLVSPAFLASDYCYNKEMQHALKRHTKGEAKVIPILLRPVHWKSTPFSSIQILPKDALPVTRWLNIDDAFYDIALGIELIIENLLLSRKTKEEWFDEATAFHNLKLYNDALAALEQAIRLDPLYIEAHQEKGATLYDLERYEEALMAFEQVISIDQNRIPPHLMKGHTLNALERYEEALTIFERIMHYDPNLTSAYIGRDKALQKLGIFREAQKQLEKQLQEALRQLVDEQKISELFEKQLQEALRQLADQQKISELLEKQLQEIRQELTRQTETLVEAIDDVSLRFGFGIVP